MPSLPIHVDRASMQIVALNLALFNIVLTVTAESTQFLARFWQLAKFTNIQPPKPLPLIGVVQAQSNSKLSVHSSAFTRLAKLHPLLGKLELPEHENSEQDRTRTYAEGCCNYQPFLSVADGNDLKSNKVQQADGELTINSGAHQQGGENITYARWGTSGSSPKLISRKTQQWAKLTDKKKKGRGVGCCSITTSDAAMLKRSNMRIDQGCSPQKILLSPQ